MEIIFEVHMTEDRKVWQEGLLQLLRQHNRKTRYIITGIVVLTTIAIIIRSICIKQLAVGFSALALVILALLVCFFGNYATAMIQSIQYEKRVLKNLGVRKVDTTITFGEERMVWVSPFNTIEIPYNELISIHKTKTLYILESADTRLYVSQRGFIKGEPENFEQFITFIKR